MCLAVPGKILAIAGDDPIMRVGRVDFGGIVKEINLAYTPEAEIGVYVLVHVGFAISVLDEEEAGRVFEHLRVIGEIDHMMLGAAVAGDRERDRCLIVACVREAHIERGGRPGTRAAMRRHDERGVDPPRAGGRGP